MRITNILSLFICLLVVKQSVANTTTLDSAYIESFAKAYLTEQFPSTEKEKILISVSRIDPRITIKPCNIPLTANIPEKNNARNVNIKISCNESTPWKIYLSAKIEITKGVLIAKNTISKGDKLDETNVELAFLPVNKVRGRKLTDTSIVYGAKAKRRIGEGKVISKKSICLVCKGDIVTIIASSDSFSIKTQGVALSSGNIGEQIRVRNSRSDNVITPRIKSVHEVIINL